MILLPQHLPKLDDCPECDFKCLRWTLIRMNLYRDVVCGTTSENVQCALGHSPRLSMSNVIFDRTPRKSLLNASSVVENMGGSVFENSPVWLLLTVLAILCSDISRISTKMWEAMRSKTSGPPHPCRVLYKGLWAKTVTSKKWRRPHRLMAQVL